MRLRKAVFSRAFAQGVVGEMVGGADGLHKGLADVGVEIGALPEDQALPAVLLDDLLESVGHIIQGFVPGGLSPFPGAPGAGSGRPPGCMLPGQAHQGSR